MDKIIPREDVHKLSLAKADLEKPISFLYGSTRYVVFPVRLIKQVVFSMYMASFEKEGENFGIAVAGYVD